MGFCCSKEEAGPPADFVLSDPNDFRKVQGWDHDQQKIVNENDEEGGGNSQDQ
eukprot:TRINITY_DN61713_c0_g1_i1.p1 TRINITY_DN61713_c0_g1~~TRINITY_DN61713_c0_g1_i1.p1  ORF type:complete len:53 (+),score=18.42 TRINITY_DN61713_c0_g1_i1:114-272(+)